MGNYNLLSVGDSRALFGLEIQGHLAIRPESIQLLPGDSAETDSLPAAVVKQRQLLGNIVRYQVESAGALLQVDRLNRNPADLLADGAPVRLRVQRDDMREVR
ncbi:TOBE domain-containing protein [Chromobacterium haemolyticum]|nr:TOBE domain-containing protein [Chromobacterium haemolyticum]